MKKVKFLFVYLLESRNNLKIPIETSCIDIDAIISFHKIESVFIGNAAKNDSLKLIF